MEKNKTNIVESDYDLELDKVISIIKKEKAKTVCLQFPDGLKPKATEVAKIIEDKTHVNVLIWLGSCFGACDVPNLDSIKPKVDLLFQFGHSKWKI